MVDDQAVLKMRFSVAIPCISKPAATPKSLRQILSVMRAVKGKCMVIIISTLEDATARAVVWALGRAGIPTYLLDLLNFPSGQTCSIFPRKVGALVETKTTDGEVLQFSTRDVRVVWNRRVDSKYFN